MRKILIASLASAAMLAGCNTVRGVGRDVESVADAFDPGRTYATCGSYGLIDRNGDGRISADEWNAYRGGAFAAWDANHDGRVSQREFSNCWYGGGFWGSYNHANWRPAFDSFDLNHDGWITADEFFSTASWARLDPSNTGYITAWPWGM
jgi:predicted small secreted protein